MSVSGQHKRVPDTTLSSDARRRIQRILWADLVVGVPTHRNARTLGEVLDALRRGIRLYLPNHRVVLMNSDGGSSDNTVRSFEELDVPPNVEKLLIAYEGPTGKGTAVRSIFEASAQLGAKACVVIEARAPGITSEWLPSLVDPVLRGEDAVLGCYRKSAYSAALTDNLAYPFLRMFTNADLREPLAGEFCVSGALAAELAGWDIWETDVTRFGVNAWISMHCLARGLKVSHADLGYHGDISGEPGTLVDARFSHSVGTLFRLLSIHRDFWQGSPPERRIPHGGEACTDALIPCPECDTLLIEAMYEGRERYEHLWRQALLPRTLREVLALLDVGPAAFEFPLELWTRVALEYAVVYNEGEGDPDRVIDSLQPLFYGRAGTYVRQTMPLTPDEREEIVQGIYQAFLGAQPAFHQLWTRYYSCLDDLIDY